MAKGDVILNLATVTTGNHLIYQPASGIQTMITTYGTSSGANDVHCEIYNGTQATFIGANTPGENNIRVMVNNSIYLRLQNNNGSSKTLGYSGIQVE